tara:strand:+ start:218 stop:1558 length:1341 start_codon:yes stop_codon:yes gene_type:complete
MAYVKPVLPKTRGRANVGIDIKGTVRGDVKTFKSGHAADINNSYQLDVEIPPSTDLIPVIDFVGYDESTTKASTFGATANPSSSCRFVGIANTGNCSVEIALECRQWEDNTTNTADAVLAAGSSFITNPMVTMLLHKGESVVLPTNRMLVYNAANGSSTANQASAGGAKVTRGTIGPTDGNGYYASELGPDTPEGSGIVPGSILMNFYSNAYAPLGLTGYTYDDTSTGLAANTQYAFRMVNNFGTSADIAFTTDTNNVNWGGTNGVLNKINTALGGLASPHDNFRLVIARDNRYFNEADIGDVCLVHPDAISGTSEVNWENADAILNFLNVGNIPAKAAIPADVQPTEVYGESSLTMYDSGYGKAYRSAGGTCSFNYTTAPNYTFHNCPPNSTIKVTYHHASAHSGTTDMTSQNIISGIYATTLHDSGVGNIYGGDVGTLNITVFG